jgi:hypothetical protein
LRQENRVASFGGGSAGQCDASRLDQTPFILERANPSKDGDAKRWAFTVWDGCLMQPLGDGRQAAEGVDRGEEPVRPQLSPPTQQ